MEEGYKIFYKENGEEKSTELSATHATHARNKFVKLKGGYKKMGELKIGIVNIVTC